MAQTRDSLSEVTWRNRTVPVKNSRVRTFLLANRDFNSMLDKCTTLAEKSDSLEQHLMDCKDAMLAIRDDIKTEQVRIIFINVLFYSFSIRFILILILITENGWIFDFFYIFITISSYLFVIYSYGKINTT